MFGALVAVAAFVALASAQDIGVIACAQPQCVVPLGCKATYIYDDNGCAVGCGKPLCTTPITSCPLASCQAPPAGCFYKESDKLNANGCPAYPCGILTCCDKLLCAALEPGCVWLKTANSVDPATGCQTSCGVKSCQQCESLVCPACVVDKSTIEYDERGCQKTCGKCATETCAGCPAVLCALPADPTCVAVKSEVDRCGCPLEPCKFECGSKCPQKEQLCAAPAAGSGCRFVNKLDENGCPVPCATECEQCPVAKCVALADGCEFVKKLNDDNCFEPCAFECKQTNCPQARCALAENCHLVDSPLDPSTGCPKDPCAHECVAECPKIACEVPPSGCKTVFKYDDENKCPISCGFECETNPNCPVARCAAPPAGCEYVQGDIDPETNCPKLCQLKCDQRMCPIASCAAPPPNCNYVEGDIDPSTGCPKLCVLKCDGEPGDPVECAPLKCKVEEGCKIDPDTIERDENGCQVSCGRAICQEEPTCPRALCMVPNGCKLVNDDEVDANGCPSTKCNFECDEKCDVTKLDLICENNVPDFCKTLKVIDPDTCEGSCRARCSGTVFFSVTLKEGVDADQVQKALEEKLPNGAEVKVVAVDGRKNKFDVRVKGDVEVAPEDEEEAAKLAILLRVASRKELSDTSEEILSDFALSIKDVTPDDTQSMVIDEDKGAGVVASVSMCAASLTLLAQL